VEFTSVELAGGVELTSLVEKATMDYQLHAIATLASLPRSGAGLRRCARLPRAART
jgi:hypothetical protein